MRPARQLHPDGSDEVHRHPGHRADGSNIAQLIAFRVAGRGVASHDRRDGVTSLLESQVRASPAGRTEGVDVVRKMALMVFVAGVALVGNVNPVSGVAGFGDIENGRYYTEAVQWMVDNAVTTGTSPTCFSPDRPVTRGQVAAFLHRMEGEPNGSPPHSFVDVVATE